MENNFLELRQGNFFMPEYNRKLNKFANYSYHTKYATNGRWEFNQYKFIHRGDTSYAVSLQVIQDCKDLV